MTAPQILVADDLGQAGLDMLSEAGEVTLQTGLDEAGLREALRGKDALIVRSATKVTAGALEGADRLTVIGRAGIGIDNIDVDAATARGIVVMNTPHAGAVTTGELAIALLVSMARHIPAADQALKAGRWDKKQFTGVELTGKTFGVVGLGNIGRVVASRGVGLHMEVIAYDPYVTQDQAPEGVRVVSLNELCETSDFVSIHVPLLDATRHLFDRTRLESMKKGARLIHAARGGIVDDEALCDLLESGHLAQAALDVFEVEPPDVEHRLRKLPNVTMTPHIGASTKEAKENVSRDMASQIVTCLKRGVVLNGINVPRVDPATAALVAPYLDVTRDVSRFLASLFPGRIEAIRVTLQGQLLDRAADSVTTAAVSGALAAASEVPLTPVNAMAVAEKMDVRTYTESAAMKQDFQNLVRIELAVGGERHQASCTVFGHRHGRLIDLNGAMMDLIPEPPLMVTSHVDEPGTLGQIGLKLGELGVNIDRMSLAHPDLNESAMAIWNLTEDMTDEQVNAVRDLPVVNEALAIARAVR
ncbi:MAG: phosphoglycerate dehydrogenase [Planctomycetota bacterium]